MNYRLGVCYRNACLPEGQYILYAGLSMNHTGENSSHIGFCLPVIMRGLRGKGAERLYQGLRVFSTPEH